MRRILTFIIAFSIIVSMTAHVSAYDAPTVTVSTATGTPGSTVEVTVSIQNNPGIVSMSLNVSYDENIMTLTGIRDLGSLAGGMHTDVYKSPYILTWANDTSNTDFYVNGAVAALIFTINSQAQPGTYTVGLTTPIHGIYNYNISEVDFRMVSGSVTVTGSSAPTTPDIPSIPSTPSLPDTPPTPSAPIQPGHVHTMRYVDEVAATCAAEGIKGHWLCTQCGRMYADAQGMSELSSVYIPRNMKNHVGTTYIKDTKSPTANAVGYSGDTYCLGCNALLSSWAYKDMQWAVGSGVYTGSYGTLTPQKHASRAHVAAMLYNFCRIYGLTV